MPPDQHVLNLYRALIPEDVRKSISGEEAADRIAEAIKLSGQARDMSLSPGLREAASLRMTAVLTAQPRDVTLRQHQDLITKAAAMQSPGHADDVRRRAERLLEEEHPVAPDRRAAGRSVVGKAKKGDEEPPVPVFDEDGNLIGICDPEDITPLSGKKPDPAQPPAQDPAAQPPAAQSPTAAQVQAAGGQPVAKNSRLRVAKTSGLPVVVYDQRGAPYRVDRANIRKTAGLQTSAEVGAAYERKVLGRGRPADTEGDDHGRGTDAVRGGYIDTPEAQARRGSAVASGTTGAGQPRKLGPAAAAMASASQAPLPGDVSGRTVVKGAGWTDVHNSRGRLVGVVKSGDVITRAADIAAVQQRPDCAEIFVNVCNAAGRRTGVTLRQDVLSVRPGR